MKIIFGVVSIMAGIYWVKVIADSISHRRSLREIYDVEYDVLDFLSDFVKLLFVICCLGTGIDLLFGIDGRGIF